MRRELLKRKWKCIKILVAFVNAFFIAVKDNSSKSFAASRTNCIGLFIRLVERRAAGEENRLHHQVGAGRMSGKLDHVFACRAGVLGES
jgi:hypothetical protein